MAFLGLLGSAINILIEIISFLILIECFLSWIPNVRESKFAEFISMLTEPVIGPARRLLMKIPAARQLPVDFSPMLAIFILFLIQMLIQFIFAFLG